jgi:hypothetical protein
MIDIETEIVPDRVLPARVILAIVRELFRDESIDAWKLEI